MSPPERIAITEAEAEAERSAVIEWLLRRSRMCIDSVRWWRPIKRLQLLSTAANFQAAALAIKECAHLALSLEDETEAIRRALIKRSA